MMRKAIGNNISCELRIFSQFGCIYAIRVATSYRKPYGGSANLNEQT